MVGSEQQEGRRLLSAAAGGEQQGTATSSLRRRAASSRRAFFCFGTGSTPPVVEPAVMALLITVELNPTPLKTGVDGHFEPAVMRGAGVVNGGSMHA